MTLKILKRNENENEFGVSAEMSEMFWKMIESENVTLTVCVNHNKHHRDSDGSYEAVLLVVVGAISKVSSSLHCLGVPHGPAQEH